MTPTSTYRLQLNHEFDLAAATALVPYLRDLGIDWLYLSPIFAAQPGSMHGYDVIDPTSVNPELGGRSALDALAARAHDAGLRIVIDIVPNHQAATEENARWQTALATHERGWFDVDWPDGNNEPRYRRFFDVDGLVGVRVDDEAVYRATHALIFELLEQGVVDGVRVDHVDGLADPGQYLEWLRRDTGDAFIVIEKILARAETLRGWPVDGTTGYEMGDALTSLAVDPDGRARLEKTLLDETGLGSFASVEHRSKAQVLDDLFAREWARVAGLLDADDLIEPLRELTLALDVYRTYGDDAEDRARFEHASGSIPADAAARLRDILLLRTPTELATRWRQLSGPVMAKGHEDTAAYRYPALLAQNEVGGDPGDDARDAIDRFHALAADYRGLIGTSTHDSKRSEDVRARICVLSERSEHYEAGFVRWRTLVEPHPEVTAAELHFVAQTLLGAWPFASTELPEFEDRIAEYLQKALREAKELTHWIDPNEEHERRVIDCARRTIAADGRLLHAGFGPLVDDVLFFGALNSLAALTWKLALPGTPDVYRGSEMWDFSLVDPDNRRPVDFATRARVLESIDAVEPDELLRDWKSGAIKLRITANGLRARRERPDLFTRGSFVPLDAPEGLLAFARMLDDDWAVALAPRFATRATTAGRWLLGVDAWGDAVVTLPDANGTEIRVAEALGALPVALVVKS